MRKKIMQAILAFVSVAACAQDTLQTTTLKEIVFTGTKVSLPVEKSGKTIFKLNQEDIERNAGKSLGDLLNEVPGVQVDGNFGTPGSNISYYVRGGRNKQTLILIDGVPLNDPSTINAEYDLRYIPISQIESIEVLKGGLSTLYGTNAAAGVINIKMKDPGNRKIAGTVDVSAASYHTFSQDANINGKSDKWSYLLTASNTTSKGFSSAQDNDPDVVFDDDGFSRQSTLAKLGYKFTPNFSITTHAAYEQFEADYDAYEFTDAANSQKYNQLRLGVTPNLTYSNGEIEAKIYHNVNEREFRSDFPSQFKGDNTQAEVIHRHRFSDVLQSVAGLNYQRMAFDLKESVSSDTANFTLVDPYASLLLDLPSGPTMHAGIRLNTHSLYGSQFVYNLNPSYIINKTGKWRYKVFASVATNYITPTLYQLYSLYGNSDLQPEKSITYEAGLSVYKDAFTVNAVWFKRDEQDPIDFASIFDDEGNYVRGEYQNFVTERKVNGFEFDIQYKINKVVGIQTNYTRTETDQPEAFYKIPKNKFGATLNLQPTTEATVSIKYIYTGTRTTFDFANFEEVSLDQYQLVDLFGSYGFIDNKLTVYGAVNNLFDEDFIALYGYTTRGRNMSVGLRYRF